MFPQITSVNPVYNNFLMRERGRNRQTDSQTDKYRGRQTDRQAGRQTDRQTETDRDRERQT